MRILFPTLLAIMTLLFGCGQPKQKLNLFVWSDYFDPKIIADFERQYECRVIIDLYEDPDSMIAKLLAGGSSLYDIIVPSDTSLPALVKRGLLSPLRHENIPNLKNIDSNFVDTSFDPGNQYGAPCDWGTSGIFIRKQKGKTVEPSWNLIFDPAAQPGPFLLMDDARTTIGAALRYASHSLNSIDPKELAQARDLLIRTKKRSLGFEGGTGCKNRVLSKDAVLSLAYNGDAVRGAKEDPETTYILPREGSQIWVDTLSIPAKAPHRDLAEKFINFLLDEKVSAQFANFNQLATPNQAARKFINPADLRNPAIYPPPEVLPRLEYARDLGASNRLYDDLWTEIKAK